MPTITIDPAQQRSLKILLQLLESIEHFNHFTNIPTPSPRQTVHADTRLTEFRQPATPIQDNLLILQRILLQFIETACLTVRHQHTLQRIYSELGEPAHTGNEEGELMIHSVGSNRGSFPLFYKLEGTNYRFSYRLA